VHAPETAAAFAELLALLRAAERTFQEGDRAVGDDLAAVEGYGFLATTLGVALDCYLWADPRRPAFVELETPTRKWGGDNADAAYWFAPIDPTCRYRITGRRVDAAYLSITVYGGPDDGRWSTRIVATANDTTLPIAPDGSFELLLGPELDTGPTAVRLDPDAVAVVTRDYHLHPAAEGRSTFAIECLDALAQPPRATDASTAAGLRRATAFLRELHGIFPIVPPGEPNTVSEPYPVPQATYGWAAGDAAYAMGSFDLDDGEALVIEGTFPPCRFWNLCLWNPFLQTFDYRYEQVTINGGQAVAEPDGSYRLVVAARDPGVPNWLSTAGHRSGVLWFRWFLPEEAPARPVARVVPVADLDDEKHQRSASGGTSKRSV
jgi:hypothetical protein